MGGYEQTKWTAEKLLEKAKKNLGININIFRLGLAGFASSGAFNRSDWLSRMLFGFMLLG